MTVQDLSLELIQSRVRYARLLVIGLLFCAGCGSAPARAGSMPSPARAPSAEAPEMADAAARENGFSDVNTDRALNTSSHIRAWSDDLLATASSFRKEVYRLSGYVVSERIDYEDRLRAPKPKLPNRAAKSERRKAIFAISVPIEELPALLDWVRKHATVVEQYVTASRDGSVPTPAAQDAQDQRRRQLEQRLASVLQRLAQASETERPTLEAERQALEAQLAQLMAAGSGPAVKYATLNAYFEANQPQVRFNAAWVAPTLRSSLLVTDLLSRGSAREIRVGAAVGVALPSSGPGGMFPSPVIELAGYPATADRDAGVMATVGIGRYARSMGDGQNTWLNPFAGLRLGYAYIDDHAFAIAGELGIELFKSKGVALSASVRPQGLLGSNSQVALEAGSSLTFAF